MTEYQKLLEAIASYYGAGSDQWLTIATSSNISSTEWAEILSSTPGVNVTYNTAGEVVKYTVDQSWGAAGDAITSSVNSNLGSATLSNVQTLEVPANTTLATGTTTVEATSGMKTVATGATVKTVVKDVVVGIGAVAAGLQGGALIDQIAYNINPDFWDDHNLSTVDPTTWADIVCETETGKKIFNFVFGIDDTHNTTQAYMDETAYAYCIKYMLMNNVFANDNTYDDDPTIDELFSQTALDSVVFPICAQKSFYYIDTENRVWKSVTTRDDLFYFLRKNSTDPSSNTYSILVASTSPDPIQFYFGDTLGTVTTSRISINDNTYYINGSAIGTLVMSSQPGNVAAYTSYGDRVLTYYAFNGTPSSTPVPGMGPQPGATLPTGIDPTLSVAAILAALKLLYPDLFANGIYNDVVQPDGTVKRINYIPVPTPEQVNVSPDGDIQPSGGTQAGSTQADPTIDPTQTPEDLIKTLIDIITATDPYDPTKTTPTNDYPDTGSGNTPAIVTPTGSASALYSIYNPSQTELNDFGAWLWSSNFVDQLLKVFNDPMQAIIGLHKIFATPTTGTPQNIKVGYLDSGVSANTVTDQYAEVNCGSVNLLEYFGNALDYTHTDIYLYLPFVGIVSLNTVDVMRATINVTYKVDVLTGACLANVNVYRDNNAGGQLYTYAGNCAVQYPLSSGSYVGIVAGVLGIAGSVAGTIATGGALLPMALGAGAAAMSGAKTKVEHSGSISGNAGAMGIKKPYLIIRRPQTLIAENFEAFDGVSNNKTITLGSCTGVTKVSSMHLTNIPATSQELDAIENILMSGIII